MPLTLDPVEGGRRSGIEVLSDKDYKYSYPHKLNLKPGSDTSNMIVRYVMDRARESYMHMDTRHKTWEKIDESLTAYISLDEKEKAIRSKDARRPVSIVVPLSYATLETLLAYWISAFLETPVFRYSGVGPEDTLGAILLEKVIEHQTTRAKMGLSLYTQARDAYAYGFGAGFVRWIKKSGFRRRPAPTGFWGQFSKAFVKTGMINEKIPVTLYDGE